MNQKALLNWIIALAFAAIAAAVLSGAWLVKDLTTAYYGAHSPETFVEIPRGARPDAIATLLQQSGVLRHRLPFVWYLRWTGAAHRLRAGEYRFATPETPIQIAQKILLGQVYYVSLTVPEGLTAQEILDRIAAAKLGNSDELRQAIHRSEWIRDLSPDAEGLEGYLFPDTYHFRRKTPSEQIIKTMVDQFRTRFTRLITEHPIRPGWDVSQVVILASLVEKEVKQPQERPLVASVLMNRLNRRMPLGCDPTVIYALKLAGRYDGNIRKSDLAIASPYNTYLHPGLPPGPIANPGTESLKAVLDPATTNFLYYVSRNDGTHEFSKDFQSHLLAVNRFQRNGNR